MDTLLNRCTGGNRCTYLEFRLISVLFVAAAVIISCKVKGSPRSRNKNIFWKLWRKLQVINYQRFQKAIRVSLAYRYCILMVFRLANGDIHLLICKIISSCRGRLEWKPVCSIMMLNPYFSSSKK